MLDEMCWRNDDIVACERISQTSSAVNPRTLGSRASFQGPKLEARISPEKVFPVVGLGLHCAKSPILRSEQVESIIFALRL